MAAVTQTINSYLGGVSKQTDKKKLPGQVRECLNAYPDPTYGLRKRPGFKYINHLHTSSDSLSPDFADAKWFFIKRDDNEQYIGNVTNTGIRIWNKEGTECTVHDNTYKLTITSDGGNSVTTQRNVAVTNVSSSGSGMTVNIIDSGIPSTVSITSGGTGYSVATDLSTTGGTGSGLKVNVTSVDSGKVTGVAIHTAGTGYKVGDVVTINTADKNCTLKITGMDGASEVFVCTQGTGYAQGDTLKVAAADHTGDADLAFTLTTKPTAHYLDTTRNNYDILTVQDTSIITNKTKTVTALSAPSYVLDSTGRVIIKAVDYSSVYNVKLVIGSTTYDAGSKDGIGGGKTFTVADYPNNGAGFTAGATATTTGGSGTGLTVKTIVSGMTNVLSNASEVVEAGTGYKVGDTITVVAPEGGTNATITVTETDSLHPFVTRNDDKYADGAATFEKLSVDEILTELELRLNALTISGHVLTVTKLGASLELELKTTGGTHVPFEVYSEDGRGGANMFAYTQQASVVSDLPAQCIDGRIVKVINSSQVSDAYWTKFVADDHTSGPGYWEETVAPNVSTGIDPTTLPHELKNTAANVFKLEQGVWTGRNVGDLITNPDPSFVGKTIQQAFFHNNRFGVLTEDNVSMSQTSDFFNFYYSTALAATDSDPIDINTSSIRPATLYAVIPTAQGLILFSKYEQFIMFADAKILTPSTTIIRGISNYEVDETVAPVDVGTNITFISKTPSYTRVFNMITRGAEENPVVEDIGKVVSEWIPDTVNDLITSPQNSLIAMYGTLDDTMYIYKTYIVGDRRLMQAWVKWDFPGNIQHASIDADTLWTVVEYKGKYVLASASLTQTPEEKIIVNSEGQQVNPHMDLYGSISSMTYDSTNKLTKCYLPTGMRDNEDLTPVLVIAGNGTDNFGGVTESGFTLNPNRPTEQNHNTSSPYFEVPNKDLTNITTTDVIVGYKYKYDIEIPKIYFKLNNEGNVVDYTASLTVSRVKFALGLSSLCSFKVKSKGYRGEIAEFTGDGSTTAFSVPFLLKEENGIKITLDGARQDPDDFTVTRTVEGGETVDNSDTVTFDVPPLGITTKQYYFGTGYSTVGYDKATTGGSGTGLTVDYFTVGYAKAAADQTGTGCIINAMSSNSPYWDQSNNQPYSDAQEQVYEYCWQGFNNGSPTIDTPYFCLDVDGDGIVSPTDSTILIRYLIGPAFAGDALIKDLPISDNAARKTADDIRAFIDNHKANTTIARGTYNGSDIGNKNVYDIDANGSVSALNDVLPVGRIFGAVRSDGTIEQTSGLLNPHDGGPATWDGSKWIFPNPRLVVKNQGSGYKPNDVITITDGNEDATFLIDKLGKKIEITTDTWCDVQPSSDAGQYLADDVPLVEEKVYTIPIHQRAGNFSIRVFSDSPFPVSLNSMTWEGQYSPRYYRRT